MSLLSGLGNPAVSDSVEVSDLSRARLSAALQNQASPFPNHKHVQTGADPDPRAFQRPEV